MAQGNRQLLEQNGLTVEDAIRWVRAENASLIREVSAPRSGGTRDSRTSPEQVRLLEDTNARDDLEMLIHLNERLQRLADGVAFLERAEAADRPRTYSSDSRAPEDRRAPSGYDTSSGRIDGYDTDDERPTTGRLQNVRRPMPGLPAPPASRQDRRPQRQARQPRSSDGGELCD